MILCATTVGKGAAIFQLIYSSRWPACNCKCHPCPLTFPALWRSAIFVSKRLNYGAVSRVRKTPPEATSWCPLVLPSLLEIQMLDPMLGGTFSLPRLPNLRNG